MSALVVSMSTGVGFEVGAVLIGVGAFLQYWATLLLDDRRDAKEQDRVAVLNATAPRVPVQRDGGAS